MATDSSCDSSGILQYENQALRKLVISLFGCASVFLLFSLWRGLSGIGGGCCGQFRVSSLYLPTRCLMTRGWGLSISGQHIFGHRVRTTFSGVTFCPHISVKDHFASDQGTLHSRGKGPTSWSLLEWTRPISVPETSGSRANPHSSQSLWRHGFSVKFAVRELSVFCEVIVCGSA